MIGELADNLKALMRGELAKLAEFSFGMLVNRRNTAVECGSFRRQSSSLASGSFLFGLGGAAYPQPQDKSLILEQAGSNSTRPHPPAMRIPMPLASGHSLLTKISSRSGRMPTPISPS